MDLYSLAKLLLAIVFSIYLFNSDDKLLLGAIVAYKLNKSLPYFFFVFLKLKVSLSLHVFICTVIIPRACYIGSVRQFTHMPHPCGARANSHITTA